jgi:hypothetical protein
MVVISAPNLAAVVPALPVKVGPNLGPNTLVTLLPTPNVAPPTTAAFVPVTAVLTVKKCFKNCLKLETSPDSLHYCSHICISNNFWSSKCTCTTNNWSCYKHLIHQLQQLLHHLPQNIHQSSKVNHLLM